MENKRAKYREVFSGDIAVEVLNDMGKNCGFFSPSKTMEQTVLTNYFRSLLFEIGVFDDKYIDDGSIIRKLMELPLMPEIKKEV